MDRLRSPATCAAAWAARMRASPPPDDSVEHRDGERGQGLAEYALILGLIAIVAIGALVVLGSEINELVFTVVAQKIQEVVDMVT